MLIQTMTRHPIAIPLATITRAEAMEGGDWRVIDGQGDEHRVSKIAWEMAVEGTPTAMLPALPGTYLISPLEEEDGSTTPYKTNVLGWMVCADTEVRPVCLDPHVVGDAKWDVLHPDGRVERNDGTSWPSLTEWLASEGKGKAAA